MYRQKIKAGTVTFVKLKEETLKEETRFSLSVYVFIAVKVTLGLSLLVQRPLSAR